ncbi:MAG: hypothetical protein A2X61_01365 [Ignavibacteria bacterium GWB2_35_12]|nr:MAG: hypothetical protein A2X61_01365 [Ignavibacteria bacterium GWB2_35_12]OGV23528.1 MAG: hypothetical protein A2475_06275 [Ignavibacteria bacterium RIFOXYC2_FULL_35_21]
MIFLVGFFWYLQALMPDSAAVVATDINYLLTTYRANSTIHVTSTNTTSQIESFLKSGSDFQIRNKVENWGDDNDKIIID